MVCQRPSINILQLCMTPILMDLSHAVRRDPLYVLIILTLPAGQKTPLPWWEVLLLFSLLTVIFIRLLGGEAKFQRAGNI